MKKLIIFLLFISCSIFAQVPADNFKKHVSYLASDELEGRGLGTKGASLAKEYIASEFESAGLLPFFDNSFFQEFPLKMKLAHVNAVNIAGYIQGSDEVLKNEFIVIGAHYDHVGYDLNDDKKVIFNGADDNASGVAMLIELAKSLASNDIKPKRSIIFVAFDAEESGLIGSSHFVSKFKTQDLKNIKKMFSIDMVGMLEANKKLELKGITQLIQAKDIVEKHAKKFNISLDKVNSQLEQRTDTYSFGIFGIPSTHVFTGLKSPYHKPEDKYNLLDYKGMQSIHQFLDDVVLEMANAEVLEANKTIQKVAKNSNKVIDAFRYGLVVNLGSGKHLYRDEFFNAKERFSFSTGLTSNLALDSHFNLNLEALYDNNASRSANGTFRRHSITIPFNLEYGTDNNGFARAFLYGGAYYRYHFSGNDGGVFLDFDQTYRQSEWGFGFGFGFVIDKFRLTFGNRTSLNTLFQDSNLGNIKARETFVGLTFRL